MEQKVITLTMPQSLWETANQKAKEHTLSMNAWIRQLIIESVAKEKHHADSQ